MAGTARVGRIHIDVDAGTAKFTEDLNRAGQKLREFGTHGVTGVQATSAALRTLEGNITNNLRAAERFLANTLHLGDALKAAFPVVGAVAFGGVLVELAKRATELYQAYVKLQEAPKRIGEEFTALLGPVRIANDELAVANAKLENEIAKLQGRRQNTLALALAEARLEADKLAQSINNDLKEVEKLLETEQIGAFKGFFSGNAATSDLTDQIKKFREQYTDIGLDVQEKLSKTTDPTAKTALYEEATKRRRAAIDSETQELKKQLAVTEQLQANRTKTVLAPAVTPYGPGSLERRQVGGPDQSARIAELKNTILNLEELSEQVSLRETNSKLTGKKDQLEEARANAALSKPFDDAISADKAKLQEVRAAAAAPPGDTIASVLAKGFGEATRQIEATNKVLAEHGQKLTIGQAGSLTVLNEEIVLTEAATRAREKQVEVQKEIEEGALRIEERIRAEADADDERLRKMELQNNELREQIKYASMGPEAAWTAKFNAMPTATGEDLAKRTEAYNEHVLKITEAVAKTNEQTEATKRLAAAANQRLEAQREAEVENIRASGENIDQINAQIAALKARWQLEDAQTMRGASSTEGATRYFHEMVDNARSAGAEVHDVLSSAFDGVNDSLARMISGQKASFAGLFQGLADQVAKAGLQNLEANVVGGIFGKGQQASGGGGVWTERIPGAGGMLGKLGGMFGASGAGQRDGSSASTALYVQFASTGGSFLPGGSGDNDGAGGFFGNLLQFAGFRAEGGDVAPGNAYVVGERGPELWTPSSRGTITPNNRLGSTAYYTIDARGANEADVEMRVQRAIATAHGSAVRQGIASIREARLRGPRSKM